MSCWSTKIHCRCLNCEHRQALRHKPVWYVRPPQCNVCGKRRWYVDKWMMGRDTSPRTGMGCMCGGYHFIHRKGSKFCYEHPNAEQHHTERAA